MISDHDLAFLDSILFASILGYAFVLGLMTLVGYLHPVGTFGRLVASYTLVGMIALMMPLITMAIVAAIWFRLLN